MFEIKYKQVGYFDEYPKMGEEVFIKTQKGIFKAKYQKWDWSDQHETPYFDFKEGNEKEVIAWSYQPERLNPEGVNSLPKDGILNPDWRVRLVNACESPNSENK